MSDFDRNYASPFGRAVGQADAAALDAGLRSYMLSIYNYMAIGLAITGFAALGVFMWAVTGDAGSAATSATGAAVRISAGQYLTPFGYAMFATPLKWVFIFAPLVMVFVISFGINRLSPAAAQMLFWAFAALMGISLSSVFLVYTQTSIVRVFFITAATFGAISLYGYTTKRDLSGFGSFLMMGLDRHHHRERGEHVPRLVAAAVRRVGHRRAGVRGPHRLGYAAPEERLHLRCRQHGRRRRTALRHHGRAVALPELHQPVHAAAAAARPAQRIS